MIVKPQTKSSDESAIVAGLVARMVLVGSTNPVKIAAVRAVLLGVAPSVLVDGVDVSSSVAEQPWGDEETIRGARTRALAALERSKGVADLGVGIEGGVVEAGVELRTCAWAVVADRDGRMGTGGSLAMPLPPAVASLVREGVELGEAMDAITGMSDTKRGAGAVGILTAGLVSRQRAYEIIVTYALAPFLTPTFWHEAES